MPRDNHPYCNRKTAQIQVSVFTKGHIAASQDYYFVPSGGTIVGSGPIVLWDLADALVGEHTITVGIGSQDVLSGKTITKKILVEQCDICDLPCSCPPAPEIRVPKGPLSPGDLFIARTNLLKGATYSWRVSGGTILEGGMSTKVLVKAGTADIITVAASIKLDGLDPSCNCPEEASAIVQVVKEKR